MVELFAVYQQLKDEENADTNQIKTILYVAFAMDVFMAYVQFTVWQMRHDKSVDLYLAELWKLTVWFGEVSDCILRCALSTEQMLVHPGQYCRMTRNQP